MDLKSIASWSREELEDEARRRGIDRVDQIAHDDLVERIVAHEQRRAPQGVLEAARTILGRVVDLAVGAVAGERRPSDRPPPASSAPPRRASRPPPEPVASEAPTSVPPPSAAAAPPQVITAPPSSDPRPRTDSIPTEPPTTAEPIRTRTMARLLAEQGLIGRALGIYDELLALEPSNAELRRERDALAVPADAAPSATTSTQGDVVSTIGIDATSVLLSWEITDEGIQRAQGVLGTAGQLALRVVTIAADAQQIVRSRAVDHGPVTPSGQYLASGLPARATCFAAIGVRDGDRFVAIVHAPGVRTAPGEPVPIIATEYVRIPATPTELLAATSGEPSPRAREQAAMLQASATRVAAIAAEDGARAGASDLARPSGGASERARPSGGASERARPSGSPPGGSSKR